MKNLFQMSLFLLLLGCGSSVADDREFVLHEGSWGWGDAGCMQNQDVLIITTDTITPIKGADKSSPFKLKSRSVIYQESSTGVGGKVDGMRWTYLAKNASGVTVQVEERFSLKRKNGDPFALLAAPKRTITVVKTKQRTRLKNPRAGQILLPCDG